MGMADAFTNTFRVPELRRRILMTMGLLAAFRVGCHVPLPGVNLESLQAKFREMSEGGLGSLLGVLSIFTGGSFNNAAVFALGIMPYISASIILQLLTKVWPTLEAIAREGAAGQRKIAQYTRFAAVPICLIQATFVIGWIQNTGLLVPGVPPTLFWVTAVFALTAGAMLVMWLGEQITEYGIGNGASILIMAGIVSRMPGVIANMFEHVKAGVLEGDRILLIFLLYVAVIVGIVFITQAQRRIPIQHAKHVRGRRVMGGQRHYLPLRVNQANVMPVIFASSLMIVPSLLGKLPYLDGIGRLFQPGAFWYTVAYGAMIFFFSYFWTYLFFQPTELAHNLKEYGSFVPGIRPGAKTAEHLEYVINRITLAGAAFLCLIAVLPDILAGSIGVGRYLVAFMGGTGILIVVGVGLDVMQKIESHLLMRNYPGFLSGGGRIRGRRA